MLSYKVHIIQIIDPEFQKKLAFHLLFIVNKVNVFSTKNLNK